MGEEKGSPVGREKIDYTAFMVWFVENYPESVEVVRGADERFWEQFK